MRCVLTLACLFLLGCTEEPRSRLGAPNPDSPGFSEEGVADLGGLVPPPLPEQKALSITAISPKLAPSAGGTRITITGTGFEKTASLFVNNALVFVEPETIKANEIVATLPPLPGGFGQVPVAVLTKSGRSVKNDPAKAPFALYSSVMGFNSGGTYSNPEGPYGDAALVDLDGDGKLDLVVGNARVDYSHPNSYTIYMNEGGGSFGEAIYKNLNCQVLKVITADINKDGHVDLVFPCNDHGYYVGVALNKQIGGQWGNFSSVLYTGYLQNYGNGCYRTTSVAVGDYDEDGSLDLAIGCYHGGLQIWKGNGKGNFQYKSNIYFNHQPHYYFDMKTADFDGDGHLDLAALSAYYQVLQVVTGNGDGTFSGYETHDLYGQPWHLEVADLNHDKQMDIAVSHRYDERIVVFMNDGGNFSDRRDITLGHHHGAILSHDMNGDGILDLVVSAREGYEAMATVLLGKGDGTFPFRNTFRGSGSSPWGLGVGRINEDMKPDFVLIQADPSSAQVMLNQSQ